MVTQVKPIQYPDSDGQPMADNTLQYRWLVTIQGGIDAMFKNDPHVFVAGDLLWYPVEGNNKIRIAPDILVAFNRPKGYRGSYLQWKENNIPPQVVFEILSPSNTLTEMAKKWQFYNHYGVEEYCLYDPDKNDLSGWIRKQNELKVIENVDNWISPRLNIKFILGEEELEIYRPDGEKFVSYVELETQKELAQQQAKLAQQQAQRLADKLKELGINPDEI
jgi:Uma2 family endonuclease